MGKTSNIFISWSGDRSKLVAEALKDWLPKVLQSARPWVSTRDIEKGTRGLTEMNKALGGMGFGIACLTPENLDSEWILFEAGALSKTFDDDKARLWTYLLAGLQYQNVKQPLGQFQHTNAEKEDTRKLIHSINNAINSEEDRLKEAAADDAFDRWWPDFEEILSTMPPAKEPVKQERSSDEIMTEILEMCRRYLPKLEESNVPPLTAVGLPTASSAADAWQSAAMRDLMANWTTSSRDHKNTYHVKLDDGTEITVKGTLHVAEPESLIIFDGSEIVGRFNDPEKWWKE